jgi:hypothetical protein
MVLTPLAPLSFDALRTGMQGEGDVAAARSLSRDEGLDAAGGVGVADLIEGAGVGV